MSLIEPSPQTILVILLGASEWPLSTFQSSPAFKSSANKVRDYFRYSRLFGLSPENWLDLFDQQQDNPNAVDQAIGNFLSQRISQLKQAGTPATDLLFYYIGHGTFDSEQAYHLAIGSTRDDNISASAVAMASLAHTLKTKARHLRRIVILDCCFAAQSFKYMQSAPDQVALQQTASAFEEKSKASGFPKRGTALLCSSGHKTPSLILPDKSGTMFSEAFIRALTFQDIQQQNKTHLSLYDLKYLIAHMLEILAGESAPRPEIHSPDQSDGDVASIPFFPHLRSRVYDTENALGISPQSSYNYSKQVSSLQMLGYSVSGFPAAAIVTIDGKVVETLRQRSQQEDMKDSLGVIGESEAPRLEVRSPDQSKRDIADVSHTPYIATPTDYSLGKMDLNLPQQDKALSFHQHATHSVLKLAPEPQKDATYEEQALQLHQNAFCDIFGFSLDDLADNRQGLLSDRQLRSFMNEHTRSTWIRACAFFLSLSITVWACMAVLFPRLPWWETILHSYPSMSWLLLLFSALSTLFLVPYSSKNQGVFTKRVECIEGKIKTRVEARIVVSDDSQVYEEYYYDIDSRSFQVSETACDALISTISYRLYYLPGVFRIVSIEPLEAPTLISLLKLTV